MSCSCCDAASTPRRQTSARGHKIPTNAQLLNPPHKRWNACGRHAQHAPGQGLRPLAWSYPGAAAMKHREDGFMFLKLAGCPRKLRASTRNADDRPAGWWCRRFSKLLPTCVLPWERQAKLSMSRLPCKSVAINTKVASSFSRLPLN
jgi:hypothetical protein